TRVFGLSPGRAGTAMGAVFTHPVTGIVSTWERSDLPDALVLGDKDKVRAGTVHVAPWSWIKRKESVLHVEAVHTVGRKCGRPTSGEGVEAAEGVWQFHRREALGGF